MSERPTTTGFHEGQRVRVLATDFVGVIRRIDSKNRVLRLDLYREGTQEHANVPYTFDEVEVAS